MENTIKATKTDNDGRQWYKVVGYHVGLGVELDDEYAVCADGSIIVGAEEPEVLTDGDSETEAVRQAILEVR